MLLCCSDDQDPCERRAGSLIDTNVPAPLPGKTWPVTITVSLQQGKALSAAVQAGTTTAVTLSSHPAPKVEVPIVFSGPIGDVFFGAAMGTGALGALWSAHTRCSARQIRDAVAANSRRKVHPSLRPAELKARYCKGMPQVGSLACVKGYTCTKIFHLGTNTCFI
jgi:hypothetical protein